MEAAAAEPPAVVGAVDDTAAAAAAAAVDDTAAAVDNTAAAADEHVVAAAALLNGGTADADFEAASEMFEKALALDPWLRAAEYGLQQCQRALGNAGDRSADAAVLAEAGATLLNAATAVAHFDDAILQFEEALRMDLGCELAQYGLEQAKKGRELTAQMEQEDEPPRKWSLRAGRSAAMASAGLDKLRQDVRSAAQRSMAELGELAAGEPPPISEGGADGDAAPESEPEPEPDPEPEPGAESAPEPEPERAPELEPVADLEPEVSSLMRTNSEDVKVESLLSRMDEMMQELGDDDDDVLLSPPPMQAHIAAEPDDEESSGSGMAAAIE